jgi:hypothetical protein
MRDWVGLVSDIDAVARGKISLFEVTYYACEDSCCGHLIVSYESV